MVNFISLFINSLRVSKESHFLVKICSASLNFVWSVICSASKNQNDEKD